MNITNTTASATCSSMDENEDFSLSSSTSRTVIASKRAAQNRAAQRAFRQRRERYIKDLEKRVKEMATWPEEIEHLRFENKHLREHVSILLRRISELTSQQMTPPLSSASSAGSCDAAVTTSSYHAYPPHHHPAHHITQGPVPHAISQQYPGQHNHPPQYNYALAESQPERFYHHDMPIRNSAQQPPSYQQHVSQQQQQLQENTWDINDDLDLDFPFDSFFDNGRCATTVIAPGEHQHNYSNQDMHTMDIQQWQYCTST
ncbi:predicted protein [Lichtheimia corymbifera JMRC:FSU:9682]|uniref:Putative transcription factor kapC n=1 Tax=Lichtheimia corymbifera JMRC:FSU:9682 TaxID=1263082 RepID=A0A068RVM5_9FUNG|nr:predicted protein [Lichtheimia corymbifera JMRC:FSU:9682]